MDKLQTNHRGVFVLSDYKFKVSANLLFYCFVIAGLIEVLFCLFLCFPSHCQWLERYASDDPESKAVAGKLVQNLSCGIVRGILFVHSKLLCIFL